jgi:hypothetical protein
MASDRLATSTGTRPNDALAAYLQGRRRLVPAESISEYVQLLLTEAGGDDGRAA